MGGIAAPIMGAAALGGSLFGKNKNEGVGSGTAPGASQSFSGFAALPEEAKSAYIQKYLPAVLEQFNRGGTQLAPLSQGETNAFNALQGGFSNLSSSLPEYQNFYNQQVFSPYYRDLYNENVLNPQLAQINEQSGIAHNNLLNNVMRGRNLGAPYSSVFGGQLAGLQEATNRMKLEARQNAFQNAYNMGQNAFQNAYGTRKQTLQDMLMGGGGLREYEQQQLNRPQARIAELAANLGAFPTGATNTTYGQSAYKPNLMAQIGGIGRAGLSLFGGV